MIYKIEDMAINTKFVSRISITDKGVWLVDGRSVGYVNSTVEPPTVTICVVDKCYVWTKGWRGYDEAMKLYDWFMEKANNETVNAS